MRSMAFRIVPAGCFYLVISAFSGWLAEGEARRLTVSREESRDLVYVLLESSGCTKRTCSVETLQNRYFPKFFFFEGLWSNPTGSPHIGAWAVDPKTADLWDANVCVEYRPTRVTEIQQELRRRIGLTDDRYKTLKQQPPMCDPGERVEIRTGRY
jgi:hypothetical protein